MVREKEGKILWIESKCYRKIGFDPIDGEALEKMIPDDTLIDYISDTFELDKQCVNIKQAHRKIDDIKIIGKCEIKKLQQKSVDNYD